MRRERNTGTDNWLVGGNKAQKKTCWGAGSGLS